MTVVNILDKLNPRGELMTYDGWPDEKAAQAFLVDFLTGNRYFEVRSQVGGVPWASHVFQRAQTVRADILLLPRKNADEVGWNHGALIIEIKKSGTKLGPPLSQLLDYMNCHFLVNGIAIMPSYGFLFPALSPHGPLASLMTHQHIGTATLRKCGGETYQELALKCGETTILAFNADKTIQVRKPEVGHRFGSR